MPGCKHREEDVYPAVLDGRLRIDLQGRVWRGRVRAEGRQRYLRVRISRVGGARISCLAHRLVWLHWRGPIPKGRELRHLNGNKHDNRLENLALGTHSKNMLHATHVLRTVTLPRYRRRQHPWTKLREDDVREICRLREEGALLRELAKIYGVSETTISRGLAVRQVACKPDASTV